MTKQNQTKEKVGLVLILSGVIIGFFSVMLNWHIEFFGGIVYGFGIGYFLK